VQKKEGETRGPRGVGSNAWKVRFLREKLRRNWGIVEKGNWKSSLSVHVGWKRTDKEKGSRYSCNDSNPCGREPCAYGERVCPRGKLKWWGEELDKNNEKKKEASESCRIGQQMKTVEGEGKTDRKSTTTVEG